MIQAKETTYKSWWKWKIVPKKLWKKRKFITTFKKYGTILTQKATYDFQLLIWFLVQILSQILSCIMLENGLADFKNF